LRNQRDTDRSSVASYKPIMDDAVAESKAQAADTAQVVTTIIQELKEQARQNNLNFRRLETQIRRGSAQQNLGQQ
jgi:hypothetical protein